MLSWFSRNSEVSVQASGPAVEEIARRWDAAIAQLLQQGDELLSRASQESEPELAAIVDFQTLTQLWARTDAQLRPIADQLSNVWDSISDELSAEAPPEGVMDREGAKRELALTELRIRHMRALRFVMARAAGALKKRADESGDEAQRAIFVGSGGRHLGEWAAHADWVAVQRAQTQLDGYRDRKQVPLALLEELDASARRYIRTTLEVEASHAPLQAPYVAMKVERHMKEVARTLSQYWQWRGRRPAT
jgi:hypothetical protein